MVYIYIECLYKLLYVNSIIDSHSMANVTLLQASEPHTAFTFPRSETHSHDNNQYMNILTIQMFLFWAHYFMCSRLTHSFGNGRAGDTVLSGGYPVCNALSRHPVSATIHGQRYTNGSLSSGVAWPLWTVSVF